MLDRRLRNRYSRQTAFAGIGDEGQSKLCSGTAVIVGCGALGSNIAVLLARAGVGNLRIIDRDFVEEHNLCRQVLFTEEDAKNRTLKAIAAERNLKKVNSTIKIEGIVADVNYTNVESFCEGAGVILDGLDNIETRYLLNDVARKHRIPWVYGGALGSGGMTMTIMQEEGQPCLRCAIPVIPERSTMPTCESAGVVNTAPAIIGALEANEALKILVGSGKLNTGLTVVDLWHGIFDTMKVNQRADCPACQGRYDFLEQTFRVRARSLCGQTRAVQVVDTGVRNISLEKLAKNMEKVGNVCLQEHNLVLTVGEYEILVFKDGRAIVKNTIDESEAAALYAKYIAGNIQDSPSAAV